MIVPRVLKKHRMKRLQHKSESKRDTLLGQIDITIGSEKISGEKRNEEISDVLRFKKMYGLKS